ncbi:MAG: HAD-IA family hydrolase, partial [Syntrophomonas sp.]|nr:HAD-IA family hydrolase [Syntrophomonas sp.]
YFDLIVGPESVNKMKPDPEGIIKVLNAFGRDVEQAIMIGDTYIDIEAGRRAGTKTCGASYGLGNKEELIKSRPDFIISDISELLNYVR